MASDRSANFVVKAKDAATGPLGRIGGAMGKLKSAAGAAFKVLAAGALAAGAAVAALAVSAVKAAIEDEQSTSRLNAALKARGFASEEVTKKINEQIKAGQQLGFTDDETRASLEASTRFTKDFTQAQKISSVAQDVARATGMDLATATLNVGKAFAGAGGRLLKTLGITDKGIEGNAALDAIFGKVTGSADAYAGTLGGKFAIAQDRFNEQIEALGYRLLPAVSGAMDFLATTVLPATDVLFTAIGDTLASFSETLSAPGGVLESVGAVAGQFLDSMKPGLEGVAEAVGPLIQAVLDLAGAMWGDGKGPLAAAVLFIGDLFNTLLGIIKPVLEILTAIIDAIAKVVVGAAKLGADPANNAGAVTSFGGVPMNTGGGGGYQYGGTSTGGSVTIQNKITFGNDAVSFIDTKLGQTINRGSSRTSP